MQITIKNKTFILDDEDSKFLDGKLNVGTNPVGQHYLLRGSQFIHKLIMNCPKGMVVDHINGDTLDNRKSNLRICTKLQNQYNQKKHKGNRHSKYKGVTFRKNLKAKPWEAFIYKDYKSKRLGYFETELKAAEAYNKAAKEAYGEFSRLNDLSSQE
jgi:hypothetical protein